MRRIKAILAVVAVVATMVVMSAPVIAQSQELTGGLDIARLLGLGAGALLVSGGLLVPRVIR